MRGRGRGRIWAADVREGDLLQGRDSGERGLGIGLGSEVLVQVVRREWDEDGIGVVTVWGKWLDRGVDRGVVKLVARPWDLVEIVRWREGLGG